MTSFIAAAALVVLGGLGGAAWLAWPSLRPAEAPPEDPSQVPDLEERLAALRAGGTEPGGAEPWGSSPMLPDVPRRIPADLVPWEGLPVLIEGERAWLLPLGSALLRAPAATGPVVRGRRHGRAFHAVRLRDDLFLDLVELGRLLPVIGCELVARGIAPRAVALVEDLASLEAAGVSEEAVGVVAPWLMGEDGPRVVSEAPGEVRYGLTVDGGQVEVRAWMPAVAEGIARDRLVWAGVLTWTRGAQQIRDAGATSAALLGRLGEGSAREASLETWRWSRAELLELAGVAQHLDREGIELTALFDDAFAARCAPVPSDPEQALVAAAVLNWRGAVARRAGRTGAAIAALDAALAVCAAEDEDTRADILFNRGYARLQATVAGAHDPDALRVALADLEAASRLHPRDPHAWAHQALIHHLLGAPAQAEQAWLQAATHTQQPEAHTRLLANARAARAGGRG